MYESRLDLPFAEVVLDRIPSLGSSSMVGIAVCLSLRNKTDNDNHGDWFVKLWLGEFYD